jgi:16S rRNA (adenine1518-N6/adenine1519-N6)-dimethyltransferase
MVDPSVYPKLAAYSSLTAADVVLDAGAGFGFLTRFLAPKCKEVIAVEKDPKITRVLRQQTQTLNNAKIIEGDVLKVAVPAFNKAVSIPPYYLSSDFVLWLLDRAPECAILILQKEFALRLGANVGDEAYSWLSVVARYRASVELLDEVPKWMFFPQPNVDSVIVRLKPWPVLPFKVNDEVFFRRLVRWLFTQRNKKLGNALTPFLRSERKLDKAAAEQTAHAMPLSEKRVRDLSPENFGDIANALAK